MNTNFTNLANLRECYALSLVLIRPIREIRVLSLIRILIFIFAPHISILCYLNKYGKSRSLYWVHV